MSISSTSNVNVLHQLMGSALPPSMGRGVAPGQKNSGVGDQFQISPTANLLQQFLSQDVDGKNDAENGMSGLDLLKQNGEMLAGLLQTKLKGFETNLASTMQSAGIDPSQPMSMQQGVDGLLLTNGTPDKEKIAQLLGNNGALQDQFKEISRLAELLGSLQQAGTYNAAGTSAAARYAQQSQQNQPTVKSDPDARFVLNVMEGNSSYSFE